MGFKPATRTKSKLRLAIDGPTGSGKTLTALRMAMALARHEAAKVNREPRVAVIDTEFGTATKYEGDVYDDIKIKFDVDNLTSFAPPSYTAAVELAARMGYDVVVIDSLSHAWNGTDGALAMVDKKTDKGGNSFTAWKDVTPLQNQMVDAIIRSPIHVFATMRSKMEYVLETNERGKTVPKKIGLAPIQRQGIEYEFDILMDMDMDHIATVAKSRCSAIDGKMIQKPGADLMATIIHWLEQGSDIPQELIQSAGLTDAPPAGSTTSRSAAGSNGQPAALSTDDVAARLAAKRAAMNGGAVAPAPAAAATPETPTASALGSIVTAPVASTTAATSPATTPTLSPSLAEIVALFDKLKAPAESRQAAIERRGAKRLEDLSPEGAENLLNGLRSMAAGKAPAAPVSTVQAAAPAAAPAATTPATPATTPAAAPTSPAMITGAQQDRIRKLFELNNVPPEGRVQAYLNRGCGALAELTEEAARSLIANLVLKLPEDRQWEVMKSMELEAWAELATVRQGTTKEAVKAVVSRELATAAP